MASERPSFVAALGLALAAIAVLKLPQHAALFHGMLVISPLNSLFKVICLVLAFFTVLLARGDRAARDHAEYLALILLATIGLLLLVGSEELLMIFIGLELTGLSLYVMTAFDKRDLRSAEAGLKYFLFGSMASAFTLFGLSFIYGLTGSTARRIRGCIICAASSRNRHDAKSASRISVENHRVFQHHIFTHTSTRRSPFGGCFSHKMSEAPRQI